jgi:hypothetical protein
MTDITWVVFGVGFGMFAMGCWLGQELWKINRTLRRIAAGTQTLARIVAYYWLATPEQRANHAQEYQASLDQIRDFFESDAGHEVGQIIMGQPTKSKRGQKGK